MTEYPVLNDPKVAEDVKKVMRDISDQWALIEGHQAVIKEAFTSLKEEYDVPTKLLRRLAKAYHQQGFDSEVKENEDFIELYETIFGHDDQP